MSEPTDIESGLEQMSYEIVDNGALELPVSTPCAFEFLSDTEPDIDVFKETMKSHDFGLRESQLRTSNDGDFYYKAKVMTDHYKDCVVKVWKDTVRIYPREYQLDTYELSRIVHGIEDAFGSKLTQTEIE